MYYVTIICKSLLGYIFKTTLQLKNFNEIFTTFVFFSFIYCVQSIMDTFITNITPFQFQFDIPMVKSNINQCAL